MQSSIDLSFLEKVQPGTIHQQPPKEQLDLVEYLKSLERESAAGGSSLILNFQFLIGAP
jgi:hypothetical protein